MTEPHSLINLGELAKPATVLIEKISEAIGGLFRPWQVRRVAQAEAEAEKIRAVAQIEISEFQERALRRFFVEEANKQANMESITRKALEDVKEDARPKDVENDWITNFFDKCRLVSDEEMQVLWGKILAGQANKPGSFSTRTVNLVGSLDKFDAILFTQLCSFLWEFGVMTPLIYNVEDQVYKNNGIKYTKLLHLDDIGLVTFQSLAGFQRLGLPQDVTLSYYGQPINLHFKKQKDNEMEIGHVVLTHSGIELAAICEAKPVPEFPDYVVETWGRKGYVASSPWPKAWAVG